MPFTNFNFKLEELDNLFHKSGKIQQFSDEISKVIFISYSQVYLGLKSHAVIRLKYLNRFQELDSFVSKYIVKLKISIFDSWSMNKTVRT